MNPQRSAEESCPDAVAPVVQRNIQALLERRRAAETQLRWQERLAAAIGRFSGSMGFVLLHLVFYGAWLLLNCGLFPVSPAWRFDPTLVILAMAASVESIFLSTFILIAQNRLMEKADRRADLNLQISLLAEHEITRLVTMTREIAQRLGAQSANHPELDVLSQDVAPEQVLESIEQQEKKHRPPA